MSRVGWTSPSMQPSPITYDQLSSSVVKQNQNNHSKWGHFCITGYHFIRRITKWSYHFLKHNPGAYIRIKAFRFRFMLVHNRFSNCSRLFGSRHNILTSSHWWHPPVCLYFAQRFDLHFLACLECIFIHLRYFCSLSVPEQIAQLLH